DRTVPSAIFTTGDNDKTLVSIDSSTGLATRIGSLGLAQNQYAGATAFTPDGTLWSVVTTVGQSTTALLVTVNGNTGAISSVPGQPQQVSSPILGLQSDANGNLFAEASDGTFYAVDKGMGTFASRGVLSSPDLGNPPTWTDLALDSSGHMWVVGIKQGL